MVHRRYAEQVQVCAHAVSPFEDLYHQMLCQVAVPPDVGLCQWGMNGVSQTRELKMQSCPSSVVVNTQGREFGGSWFETCSGVWYPRRRPCGVSINTFVDLINWLGKPKDLVFIGDPLTTSRTKSSDRRTSASRRCGQYSLAIV